MDVYANFVDQQKSEDYITQAQFRYECLAQLCYNPVCIEMFNDL